MLKFFTKINVMYRHCLLFFLFLCEIVSNLCTTFMIYFSRLTVTDSDGATNSTSANVTIKKGEPEGWQSPTNKSEKHLGEMCSFDYFD